MCQWLWRDLISHGLWTDEIREAVIEARGTLVFVIRSQCHRPRIGSIQDIKGIPDSVKALHRTAWEIPHSCLVRMAAERGPYICQSQSMTIFKGAPTPNDMVPATFLLLTLTQTVNAYCPRQTSFHLDAWHSGLKTGMYYLRTQPATYPIHFGVDYTRQYGVDKDRRTSGDTYATLGDFTMLNIREGPVCLACTA